MQPPGLYAQPEPLGAKRRVFRTACKPQINEGGSSLVSQMMVQFPAGMPTYKKSD